MHKKNSLFFIVMRFMIVNYLRSSYRNADQRFALRNMFKIILDEQRKEFREDNWTSTVSFTTEQLVRASKMGKDWPITKLLMNVVGDPDWEEHFTNNAKNTYKKFY